MATSSHAPASTYRSSKAGGCCPRGRRWVCRAGRGMHGPGRRGQQGKQPERPANSSAELPPSDPSLRVPGQGLPTSSRSPSGRARSGARGLPAPWTPVHLPTPQPPLLPQPRAGSAHHAPCSALYSRRGAAVPGAARPTSTGHAPGDGARGGPRGPRGGGCSSFPRKGLQRGARWTPRSRAHGEY